MDLTSKFDLSFSDCDIDTIVLEWMFCTSDGLICDVIKIAFVIRDLVKDKTLSEAKILL